MDDSEVTLKITCCHTDECLHCGKPVKITIPKKYTRKSGWVVRGVKAE